MVPIFFHTRQSYSEQIRSLLGKGVKHASQIYSEWFRQGKIDSEKLAGSNAKALVEQIISLTDFSIPPISKVDLQEETVKFLTKAEDGYEMESVVIPMQAGNTLCVSSQIGCRMGCAFCETGRMGLLRSLTTKEILSQYFHAKFSLNKPIRNIVFMGMGEPLDNYEQVMQAIRILTDSGGIGLGPRHITISTSGCLDGIYRLITDADPAINLAVSVNASNNQTRTKLMPVNRKHNMEALHEAMRAYCAHPRRAILAEYVMIKDVNDSLEHADQLAAYLRGLKVKINLIPYNAQSNHKFQPPEFQQLEAFAERLRQQGYYTLWRQPKGRNIMAACGQLGNVDLRVRRTE